MRRRPGSGGRSAGARVRRGRRRGRRPDGGRARRTPPPRARAARLPPPRRRRRARAPRGSVRMRRAPRRLSTAAAWRSSRASSTPARSRSPLHASASIASGSTGNAPGWRKPMSSTSVGRGARARAAAAAWSPSDSASSPSTARARTSPGRSPFGRASSSRRAGGRARLLGPAEPARRRARADTAGAARHTRPRRRARPRCPRARAPRPRREFARRARHAARGRTGCRAGAPSCPSARCPACTSLEQGLAPGRSPAHRSCSAWNVRGLVQCVRLADARLDRDRLCPSGRAAACRRVPSR